MNDNNKSKDNTAFILIDCQVGLLEGDWPVVNAKALIPIWADLLKRARKSAASTTTTGMPIFFVRHGEGPGSPLEYGKPGWQFHPAIGARPEPDDTYFDKTTPDAFVSTNLAHELRKRGIKHIIIAGLEGPHCIRATALGAMQNHDLKVTVIKDAHSTYNSETQTAEQITSEVNDELAKHGATLVAAADVRFDR